LKIVFFDIGNTRSKFLIDKKVIIVSTSILLNNLEKYIKDYFIYFGSCVNLKVRKKLRKYKNVYFLKDFKFYHKTCYDLKMIGEDRLAAIYYPPSKNFLLLQLGSLYTLDIVKNKVHLGGYLIPSFKTIYYGIINTTFIKLGNYPNFCNSVKNLKIKKLFQIPKDTQSAISVTYINSLLNFLRSIVKKYPYPLYISGGDFKYLKKYFDKFRIKYFYVPYIVLLGLKNFLKLNKINLR